MSDRDPLAAAASLEESMRELTSEMGSLREYGHQNRRLIWALAVSLAIDLVLSVVLGFVAVQASNASRQATEATSAAAQNRQNALVTCQSGNEARQASRQLWTYVLDLSSQNPNQTPAEAKQIVQFRAYIATVYADRDCSNLASPTPVVSPTQTPTR